MKRFFDLFRNRWLLTLLGLVATALLIWFVGPLFAFAGREPLGPERNRIIVIACLFLAWAARLAWTRFKHRRDNRQVMEGMVAAPEESAPTSAEVQSAEEIAALKEGMERALAKLDKAKLGGRRRRTLAQLPWYIIIGPPGSGKTTLLRNSGLRFPLADDLGMDDIKVKGVGGTRHCDWWFADEAVLLDTAGRYATQDSDREVDRAAWLGFLGLLKKRNRRRPVNGVLIAVSLAELLTADEDRRAAHVTAIRQRIQELYERLGVRFPIYFLFTKCDLLAGFSEFFDDLGEEGRAQVWGTTFPFSGADDEQGAIAHFPAEFEALEQRLEQRLIPRLQEERDPGRRALIYAFPKQFGSIGETVSGFLDRLFRPSRFGHPPLLRGVYFTSGTQEGTPIDRLLGYLASSFGVPPSALPAAAGKGKSYFIRRLLRGVVFAEAELAGTNLRFEHWRTWLQRAGFAAVTAGVMLMAGLWYHSYAQNKAYVERVAGDAEQLRNAVEALPGGRVLGLAEILPVLDRARGIPGAVGDPDAEVPVTMRLGLYQGEKIDPEARRAYRRLLKKLLLPQLILRMEERMRGSLNAPEVLYKTLRAYLMLDDPDHYDADAIEHWVVDDWKKRLPRRLGNEGMRRLVAHLDSLFETQPVPLPIELDGALVRRARARLARQPLAKRIYATIEAQAASRRLPPLRISEAAGGQAALVFVRRSGKPLSEGVPGFYTARGYRELFARTAQQLAKTVLDEYWVLGEAQPVPTDPEALQALFGQVEQLYLKDYAQQWQSLLGDLAIVPFSDETQAAEVLRILSGKDSPLANLLAAVEENTTLEEQGGLEAKAEQAVGALAEARRRIAGLFGEEPQDLAAPASSQETLVGREFERLNAVVHRAEGRPAPLDGLLEQLRELYVYVEALASVADQGGAALGAARERARAAGVVSRLQRSAGHQPAPLNQWFSDLAGATDRVIQQRTTSYLNDLWNTEVVSFYRNAIQGRYPVFAQAKREITLEDFARFFGPGGIVDSFFQSNLKPFVDTSGRRWRLYAGRKGAPAISGYALAQLQNAAEIRQAFFPAGGTAPEVRFDLRPVAMDADITRFVLDLDGQRISYSHGPKFASRLRWPGPGGMHQVYLEMSPRAGPSSLTLRGRWAWFRLLDRSHIEDTGQGDRFRLRFELGGRQVTYELWAGSVYNPFHLPALERFRCPTRLQGRP